MAEAPPIAIELAIGDAAAIWPPRHSGGGGSLLFLRWNSVVLLSANLSRKISRELGREIDRGLQELEAEAGVVQGTPSVPQIVLQLDYHEIKSIDLPLSSKEVEIPISLEYEKDDKPLLFAPNATIGRIRGEPNKVYVFFPFRPGRRECTLSHSPKPASSRARPSGSKSVPRTRLRRAF